MSLLLVVDDDPGVTALFGYLFRELEVKIACVASLKEATHFLQQQLPDVAIINVALPDGSGLEALQKILEVESQIPILMMTAGADSQTAIQAMQMGAMDYLTKPLDVSELNKIVRRAIEVRRLMVEPVELMSDNEPASPSSAIIGRCPEMQKVYKAIGRVASQNISVLIRGESGTGKELVARAIFQFSKRKDKPFLAVNCAAIPDALLESELFGHEKGAFTGADRVRIGKFEQCQGGTLFLDEIGDMDAMLQSKLLRVLQEKQFVRVGGSESIDSDVRVVAATHRNLEQMCGNGLFREDLFYRLNGFTIQLPPLRDRGDDLELLVDFFRRQTNSELGKSIARIEPKTAELLKRYRWPGNVRELQSVVRQAVVQSTGTVLLSDFLPDNLSNQDNSDVQSTPIASLKAESQRPPMAQEEETIASLISRYRLSTSPTLYDDIMEEVERKLIAAILNETFGNQSEAAKRLGITRTTLRTKINKLGIGIKRLVE